LILLKEGHLSKASSKDIAQIVYGFGMQEFGSETLWSLLTAQVIERFEKINKEDFDMIL